MLIYHQRSDTASIIMVGLHNNIGNIHLYIFYIHIISHFSLIVYTFSSKNVISIFRTNVSYIFCALYSSWNPGETGNSFIRIVVENCSLSCELPKAERRSSWLQLARSSCVSWSPSADGETPGFSITCFFKSEKPNSACKKTFPYGQANPRKPCAVRSK